jgi:lipopolysaccharide heptosyltransferase III
LKASNPSEILPGLAQGAEVLLIRLRSLGDIVLTTPALESLHAWRPDLRIVVAVEPAYAPVLEGNPNVAEIFRVGRFLPTAARLARRRFPLVLNQHGGPTSALLTAATLSPFRVAWDRTQFSALANVRVPRPKVYFAGRRAHTAEQRISQLWQLGLPRGTVPPARVFPQPDALVSAGGVLAGRGIAPGRPYAVLQPGAAFATRRWAIENFARLARWLAAEWKLAPVVLLGPRERELAAEARQVFRATAIIVEQLELRLTIALISRARLFIGQDTGPTHLAAATGRPVVDIFGSSRPEYWRPWATPSRVVLNEFPCRPCRGDRCYAFDEPRCILSVTLEQVQQACRELLMETGK